MIAALRCPVCDTEKKTGLPNGSTVVAVTREPRPDPDDLRDKVRHNRCPNGHDFYFQFRW